MTGGVTYYNGNGGIRIKTTEIYKDNAWTFTGELPETMWGMGSISFDNKVLLFGND